MAHIVFRTSLITYILIGTVSPHLISKHTPL
jgi:hypothetical protein